MNPVALDAPIPNQTLQDQPLQVEEKTIEDKIKAIKDKSFAVWVGLIARGPGSCSTWPAPAFLIGFSFAPSFFLGISLNQLALPLLGIPACTTLTTFAVYSALYVKFRSMQNQKIEELIETSKNVQKVEEDNNSISMTNTLSNSSTEDERSVLEKY